MKYISLIIYINKEEKLKMNQAPSLEKEQKNKPAESKTKKLINERAEIDKIRQKISAGIENKW